MYVKHEAQWKQRFLSQCQPGNTCPRLSHLALCQRIVRSRSHRTVPSETVVRMSAWMAVLLHIARGLSQPVLCHGPLNGTSGKHALADAPWCGWILTVTWGPITPSLSPWKRSSRCRGQSQGLNCEPLCWPSHSRVVQSPVKRTTGAFCMARTEELCVGPMGLVPGDLERD